MITKEQFLELKEKYGFYSSFTIWKSPKDVSDISMFESDEVLAVLNDNYVFVALNPASNQQNEDKEIIAFRNFHSKDSRQKDFKLCYALQNTKFWGSYITDLFKSFPETNSQLLKKQLKDNPIKAKNDIDRLKQEIEIINMNKKDVVLIALSRDTEGYLKKYFGNEYAIAYATHYSHRYDGCSKPEIYRNKVLEQLKDI